MTRPPDIDVPAGSVLEVEHDEERSVTLHIHMNGSVVRIRLGMSREDLCSAVCATWLDEMAEAQP